jgi:hypothetical protein
MSLLANAGELANPPGELAIGGPPSPPTIQRTLPSKWTFGQRSTG